MDFAGPGILGQEVNTYLNKPPLTPFPGRAGKHGELYLLQFHKEYQLIKDTEGNVLFQNKSGDRMVEQLYENECRTAGIISWVHSPQIFKV